VARRRKGKGDLNIDDRRELEKEGLARDLLAPAQGPENNEKEGLLEERQHP